MLEREALIRISVDNSRLARGTDNAVSQLSRVRQAAFRAGQDMERYALRTRAAYANLAPSIEGANRALSGHLSLVGRLTSGVGGLVGQYRSLLGLLGGLAFGAYRFGGQMQAGLAINRQYEQNALQLSIIIKNQGEAYADARKRAEEYIQYARKWARETPYEEKDALTAFSALAPMVKGDFTQLKRLLNIAGLLAAKNPTQGIRGAIFSISEALSSDYYSLRERFNIPLSTINKLKKQGLEGAALLEAALKESKITMELVNAQAETESGLQAAISDYSNLINMKLSEGVFVERKAHLKRLRDRLAQATEEGSVTMQMVGLASQGLKAVAGLYYRLTEAPTAILAGVGAYATKLAQNGNVKTALQGLLGDVRGLWGQAEAWWAQALPTARRELDGLAATLSGPLSQGLEMVRRAVRGMADAWKLGMSYLSGFAAQISERTGLSPSTLALIAGGVLSLALAFRVLGGALSLPVRLLGMLGSVGASRRGLAAPGALAYALPAAIGYARMGGPYAVPSFSEAGPGMAAIGGREALAASGQKALELARNAQGVVQEALRGLVHGVMALGRAASAAAGALPLLLSGFSAILGSPLIRESARLFGNIAEAVAKLVAAASPYALGVLKLAGATFGALFKAAEMVLTPILKLTNAILDFLNSGNPLSSFLRNGVGLILGMVGGVALLTMGMRGLLNVGRQIGYSFREWFPQAIGLAPATQRVPVRGPDGRIYMQEVPRQMSGLQRLWASFWRGPIDEFGQPLDKRPQTAGGAFRRGWAWAANWIGNRADPEEARRRAEEAERTRRERMRLEAQRARAEFYATPIGQLTANIISLRQVIVRLIEVLLRRGVGGVGGGSGMGMGPLPPYGPQHIPPPMVNKPTVQTPYGSYPVSGGRASVEPALLGRSPRPGPDTRPFFYDLISGLFSGGGLLGSLMWAIQGVFAGLLVDLLGGLSGILASSLGKLGRPLIQRIMGGSLSKVVNAGGGFGEAITGGIATAIGERLLGRGINLGRGLMQSFRRWAGGSTLAESLGRGLARLWYEVLPNALFDLGGVWDHRVPDSFKQKAARAGRVMMRGGAWLWEALLGAGSTAMAWGRGAALPWLGRLAGGVVRGGAAAAPVLGRLGGSLLSGGAAILGRLLPILSGILPAIAGLLPALANPIALVGILVAALLGGGIWALWRWWKTRSEGEKSQSSKPGVTLGGLLPMWKPQGKSEGFWGRVRRFIFGPSAEDMAEAAKNLESKSGGGKLGVTTPLIKMPTQGLDTRHLAAMKAIVLHESHGNPRAVNKWSGALGIGQIMPENLWDNSWVNAQKAATGWKGKWFRPPGWMDMIGKPKSGWDYEALGRDLTPNQLLNDRAAQEKIIYYQIKKRWEILEKKGLSEPEIVKRLAASWYGPPRLMYVPSSQLSKSPEEGGYPSLYSYANRAWNTYQQDLKSGMSNQQAIMSTAKKMGAIPPAPPAAPAPISVQLGDIHVQAPNVSLEAIERVVRKAQEKQVQDMTRRLNLSGH